MSNSMAYAYGSGWRKLFDVIVASAQKPAYFIEKERDCLTRTGGSPVSALERGSASVYLHGAAQMLMDLFYSPSSSLSSLNYGEDVGEEDVAGDGNGKKPRPCPLYFGDHMRSDVAAAREYIQF